MLLVAIEDVYRAFKTYPFRKDMEACPCCVSGESQHNLARVRLRELRAEELGRYAFKAMTTWGSVEDYKHFLPRVLELAALDPGAAEPGLDLELIASKLHHALWLTWPFAERAAVDMYFEALWRTVVAQHPSNASERAIDCFRACSYAVGDGSRFLKIWEQETSLNASLHVAASVVSEAGAVVGEDVREPTWWRAPQHYRVLVEWLQHPARMHRLHNDFEENLNAPDSTRLAEAIDLLEHVPQTRKLSTER